MSDNLRSCASCAEDLITFEAEHRESDQPSEIIEGSNGTAGIFRTSSETRRKRFPRLRGKINVRSPEEREQRDSYAKEKKNASRRVEEYIRNNSFDKMSGWLKFRCAVFHKMWIKFYCVLKPGFLVVYKDEHMQRRVGWVGTILLSSLYIIQRPTQRGGFCFKFIHCLRKSIWVNKGPKKLQPVGNFKGLNLPLTSVIIRADSEEIGKQWFDAMRSMCLASIYDNISERTHDDKDIEEFIVQPSSASASSDEEDEDDEKIIEGNQINSEDSIEIDQSACSEQIHEETMYVKDNEEPLPHLKSDLKSVGNEIGSGKLDILVSLARQVKPNQPLSRIVIPPFVNYPKSFLDKLQDMFYRVDLIAQMTRADTPRERMELFAKFMLWLQNFHPTREMKKYYNSVLGEKSRCYFQHPNGSRTHFIAEEVTHHPPASAIYCVNKQEGFSIRVLMEFEVRFQVYYVRSNIKGGVEVTLDNLNEKYTASLPDLIVNNIFLGQFRIDFEGPLTLACKQTDYKCQIDFKTRWTPWGRESQFHRIKAKLYDSDGTEVLQAEGHWNSAVYTKAQNGKSELFWKADKSAMLDKYIVHTSDLDEYESSRLWCGLTDALFRGDEEEAIIQKTLVEQAQRDLRALREQMGEDYKPALMALEEEPAADSRIPPLYNYVHRSDSKWDPYNDEYQYEHNFIIKTHKRNKPSSSAGIGTKISKDKKFVGAFGDSTSSRGESSRVNRSLSKSSKERNDEYAKLTDSLEGQNSIKAQMDSIQKALQTLQEGLKTIERRTDHVSTHLGSVPVAGAGGTSVVDHNNRPSNHVPKLLVEDKNSRTTTNGGRGGNGNGLSWTSIVFCMLCALFCILYTYYFQRS